MLVFQPAMLGNTREGNKRICFFGAFGGDCLKSESQMSELHRWVPEGLMMWSFRDCEKKSSERNGFINSGGGRPGRE